jgi:diketogulonate reductase-like aldo/keto reductase
MVELRRLRRTSRRRFLAGAAGAAVAAGIMPLRVECAIVPNADTVRTIPSTGRILPAVGLGTWITFNVGRDPVLLEQCAEVIAAFVEEGGGMIDSSPMYGSSQDTIGYGLERLGHPESVFSAEKVWTAAVADGPQQIAESCAGWGVAAFDLVQVHNLVAWQGHLETLFAMQEDGRLGHVGVTTSHGRRHEEMERVMRAHPIDFVQLTYNVADREAEARLLPLARERGIATIVNRPFRQGALTKRLEGKPLPGVAEDLGATSWAQLILKFILSHPAVTVAIPATTQVDHLRENKASARGPLPDALARAEIVRFFEAL